MQYGCLVVNAPTANTVAAAEHGIALLCSLARNVAQADASMRGAKWERGKYVGVSLVDKTLAIMGFGKVRRGGRGGLDGRGYQGICRPLCPLTPPPPTHPHPPPPRAPPSGRQRGRAPRARPGHGGHRV
jgi:hypothetical protein